VPSFILKLLIAMTVLIIDINLIKCFISMFSWSYVKFNQLLHRDEVSEWSTANHVTPTRSVNRSFLANKTIKSTLTNMYYNCTLREVVHYLNIL